VLAAMLIVAVVPLVRVRAFYELFLVSPPQFLIAATTFVLTLVLSPHIERAVLVGVALSVAVHLWRELRLEVEWTRVGYDLHLRPQGVLWFGTARILEDRFVELLAENPDARTLRVHLRGLGRIDVTGALALKRVVEDARRAGLAVDIGLAPPAGGRVLRRVLRGSLDS
jgi:SulP family sulfate permease